MSLPLSINTLIRQSLVDTINILYPASFQLERLVKKHRWSTVSDVGSLDGKVVTWNGWSINFKTLDSEYRTIYFDFVPNILPLEQRTLLFGIEFAQAIDGLDDFVVMFNTSYSTESYTFIKNSGFIPRSLGKILHASKVINPKDFLLMPSMYWASYLVKLIRLQWQATYVIPKIISPTATYSFDDSDFLDLEL